MAGRPGSLRVGFSLIELLLVIAIVAILSATIGVRLQRARDSARLAVTNSTLRQHATVFAAYAGDFREHFPYLTDPRATYSVIRCPSAGVARRALYFDVISLWSIGLADGYYDGRLYDQRLWAPPHLPRFASAAATGDTAYLYPCAFLAVPEYWNTESRIAPPAQLHPTLLAHVLYTSKKVVLSTWALELRDFDVPWTGPNPSAFVDGHAALLNPNAMLMVRSGDGPYPGYSSHARVTVPVPIHTLDGVRGRDQ